MRYTTEEKSFKIEDLGVQEIDVYDIEVEDNHNFFANDICVHNSGYFVLDKLVQKMWPEKTTLEVVDLLDKLCGKYIQKVIDESYDRLAELMNAYSQKLSMKREVIADVGVFVAKKRYALSVWDSEGVRYEEPELKVTGLELVRSSTPKVVRETLKSGVKQVLYNNEQDVQKFIADYYKEYQELSVGQIAFPRGVNGLSKYKGSPIYAKGTPIHVRAALLYNHYLVKGGLEKKYPLITEGSKMKFVFLKMPNPFRENIIGFVEKLPEEFGLHKYIDYSIQFEKSFEDAMQTVMTPIGWTTRPRASLEDLFA